MKTNRTITREKAMTILYQIFLYKKNKINYDINNVIEEVLENTIIEDRKKIDTEYLNTLINGVLNNIDDIDKSIEKYIESWSIDRLGLTDQAILRMGIFELLYTQTPDIVAINEAVELAKQYSDEKVKNMINGVMDNILHNK